MNVPQANTRLFPISKIREAVSVVCHVFCVCLMQYASIEVFVKPPSQTVVCRGGGKERVSNWKEWLRSDALCPPPVWFWKEWVEWIEGFGMRRERYRPEGSEDALEEEDHRRMRECKRDANALYWGIVLWKTRTQICGQCCSWSRISQQLSVKTRCSQFGWELFHRKPPLFSPPPPLTLSLSLSLSLSRTLQAADHKTITQEHKHIKCLCTSQTLLSLHVL
jgi:hypothetical protein